MTITEEQNTLLGRIAKRLKDQNANITPFVLGIAMRANGHDLPLEEIKAWLIEYEMQEAGVIPVKPKANDDVGQGAENKELNKTMATETQATWMSEMDEVSSGSSNFLKFAADEDEKVLRIVKDPVKGVSKFPYPDGQPKPEFKIEVMDGEKTDIKVWAVTNRQVMQQIVAIAKKEGLATIAGCVLRVTATGNGKDRRWFLRLLSKPGAADPQGLAWLEQQKAGLKA